jgi:hypothetical protein
VCTPGVRCVVHARYRRMRMHARYRRMRMHARYRRMRMHARYRGMRMHARYRRMRMRHLQLGVPIPQPHPRHIAQRRQLQPILAHLQRAAQIVRSRSLQPVGPGRPQPVGPEAVRPHLHRDSLRLRGVRQVYVAARSAAEVSAPPWKFPLRCGSFRGGCCAGRSDRSGAASAAASCGGEVGAEGTGSRSGLEEAAARDR